MSGELEDENWRTRSNLWSWQLRTGDFVVQLLDTFSARSNLGSDDECVEFSGVNLENGFHRLDPPVRIKVEEMPLGTDGTYDIDSLLRNVGRHPDDVPGNV